jgi:hypothetical protein
MTQLILDVSKPDENPISATVNATHASNLMSTFSYIALINANGINPKYPILILVPQMLKRFG